MRCASSPRPCWWPPSDFSPAVAGAGTALTRRRTRPPRRRPPGNSTRTRCWRSTTTSSPARSRRYDDRLAAPKATIALTGAGAQFVGLRADTRHRRGTSDVDVLIFPSEQEAADAREQLAQESGGDAQQDGVFVNVTLREAKGAEADVLASCEDEASRQ